MSKKPYPTEVKTRAVELLIESQKDYPSLWAAIQAIAPSTYYRIKDEQANPDKQSRRKQNDAYLMAQIKQV